VAYEYQTISFKNFGLGINAKSSPNELADGFSERLTNIDINLSSLVKRRGYQGYAGWLPLRVREAQHTADEKLKLFFDGDVSFVNSGVVPLVVYGRLDNNLTATGTPVEFTTGSDTAHYYSTFTGSIPYTFTAPSGTGTGFNPGSNDQLFFVTQRSTLAGTGNSSWFYADTYTVDSVSPFDGAVTWSGLASDIDVFVSSYNFTGTAGRELVHTYTTISPNVEGIDISSLDNLTPVIQCYYDNAGVWTQFIPDAITIDQSLGLADVATSFPSTTDIMILFYAPDTSDVVETTVSSGGGTVVIPTTYDFFHFTCYSANSMLLPDAVDYDAATQQATYTFSALPINTPVTVCFMPTGVQSNFITLDTPGDTSVYSDTRPQLTVWGFNQGDLYAADAPNGAKVMHIDSYRREGEQRLMAGINGVLMRADTAAESGVAYKFGETTVSLDARIDSNQNIGPAFAQTAETAARTTGLVRADNITSAHQAVCTAVEFVSTGVSKYTLSLTNKTGTLASALTTSDYVTVTGCGQAIHNGTFRISSVSDAENSITVENDRVTSARYNESGMLAKLGVYTNRFTVLGPSPRFLDGDMLAFSSNVELECAGSDATTVHVRGVESYIPLYASNKIYGSRTSALVPVVAATNFVCGDMLDVTGMSNQPRILGINPSATQTCTITSDGTTATVTASAVINFRAGMRVILTSDFDATINGEYEALSAPSTSSFTVAATWVVSGLTSSIVGPTLQLDEEIDLYDASSPMSLETAERWVPLESPVTSDNLPFSTYYQHLPSDGFTNQATVRSTVIADNMYFINNQDEVLKYDGTNVYRAGLQYWAPQLFSNVDTGTASIPLNGTLASATAAGSVFTVALGAQAAFTVGSTIVSNLGDTYTVQAVGSSGSNGTVTVTSSILTPGSVTSIQLANRYRYYFRLNAIDANGNITAGAATGLDDYVIDMTAAGQIKHKLVGLPAFGMYNYDSLDVKVYRTLVGSSGPYYRVGVVDLNFNNAAGYIEFTDATADTFLSSLDPVNTALLGEEIGVSWSQPLRAKYLTSMNNKLLLMNVKGYPQLDLSLLADNGFGSLATSALTGKTFLLRKDSNDTGLLTNMVDRINFEFVTSSSGAVSSVTSASGYFEVTTGAAHGLAVGDWVYLYHAATGNNNDLTFAGWYQVASAPLTTTFRVTTVGTLATSANDVDTWVKATTGYVPVFLGTDGNYAQIGANVLNELTAIQRLASAINATMRATDVTLSGQEDFTPWIAAAAGTTQGPGRLVLRQDIVLDTTFEVVLSAAITGANWFVDGTKRAAASAAQALTPLFQSRITASYENYPEIFDSPDQLSAPSAHVIDVNAADGEELTGGLPFFGTSAFTAANQEEFLIAFKENSIYAVDIGNGVTSKLRTRGLGCTAPYSIAPTRDGIMFANNSGVYKLDNNLNVVYAGIYIEKIYQDEVNRDALSAATGTHYAIGSAYKLSVPLVGSLKNSNVLVYNHQREEENGLGAWTEYTNHPATGWANLGNNAYFASSTGSVFSIRNQDNATDFRDDADAVAETVILLRANDFGAAGIRKSVAYVTSHFEMRYSDNVDTAIQIAYDLQTAFEDAGEFDFIKSANTKVKFAQASVPRRKSNYIQVKYTNSTKDESVILAGVDYTVSGLSYLGVNEINPGAR
jgi:hypothetical protein